MWTSRSASQRIGQCLRTTTLRQKRSLHTVLKLPYENLEPGVNGIYPLFSAEGFRAAWTERQEYLVSQVNRITQGTAIAHEELFNLIQLSAQQPDMAPLFNYASSAWNNAFFFSGILPQSEGTVEPTIPNTLRNKIDMSFGNLSALRNLIFQTALSIHGSGWVWLVVGPNSDLKVLATYNAGTPFNIKARQPQDPNTNWNLDNLRPSQQTAGLRPNRRHEYLVLPILGLNVWEHAYIVDYGVNGKQQYLKNWWSTINWQRVNDATTRRTQEVRIKN